MCRPAAIRLSFICILLCGWTYVCGQGRFDIVKDFCTDPDTQSAAFSCYADSNRLFIFGITRTASISQPEHGYLSSLDYSGNVVWTRKIFTPAGRNNSCTYLGIQSLDSSRLATFGLVMDPSVNAPNVVWYPYLYIFTRDGDSIRYHAIVDSFKLRTVNSFLIDRNSFITAECREAADPTFGYHLWICRYDTLGKLLWEKRYFNFANPVAPRAERIVLSADKKSYVIVGELKDTIAQPFLPCSGMLKVDTNGNEIWFKKLNRSFLSVNDMDIVTNPTGGYYFAGSFSTLPDIGGVPQGSIVYYGKLNEQGDTIWTRSFQDSLYRCSAYQIEWSNDHQHLLLKAENGYHTPALIKIDTNGNIIWYRIIQHVYNWSQKYYTPTQVLQSFYVTPYEQYLMVGSVAGAHIPGVFDMNGIITWIVLTDSSGCRYPGDPACMPTSVSAVNKVTGLLLYPNPTSGHFTVETPVPGKLYLYDMQGRLVAQYAITKSKAVLQLPGFMQPGIYFGKFIDDTGKISVLRLSYQS